MAQLEKGNQINIVATLCDSIKIDVVESIRKDKIPPNWDGFELRHYLAEKFRAEDMFVCNTPENKKALRKRKLDCDNTILVNNL